MPSTCEFQLNNANGVYYSGDTIRGAIVLNTTRAKEVRDIAIVFRGEGKVGWTETKRRRRANGRHTTQTIHFKANDLYVENSTNVHGEGTLPPGTYTYNFEIVLPLQCPTSCEGRYGHIRYELMLKLNRPFRFDNVFSKPLTVIKARDLNLSPNYRFPIASEEIFSTCWFSCSSGSINATLATPFGGYAIGQTVNYSVFVENQTMLDIKGYTVKFYRSMTFTARTPHRKTREDNTILETKTDDKRCLRLSKRLYNGEFVIEPTPPSTEGESIIKVEYFIRLILHMPGCNKNKKMALTLFIGTVPLRESILPTAPTEGDDFIDFAPTAPNLTPDSPSDAPPSYKELGPPTFEEATRCSTPFVDDEKDEHHRHIGFRPLYPSFSQSDD